MAIGFLSLTHHLVYLRIGILKYTLDDFKKFAILEKGIPLMNFCYGS